jgi:hypothetical protein
LQLNQPRQDTQKESIMNQQDFGETGTYVEATGLVKTGAGVLRRICLGGPTGGSAGTLTVYDGLTNAGTVKAVIPLSSTMTMNNWELGIHVNTGIYIELATATGLHATIVHS